MPRWRTWAALPTSPRAFAINVGNADAAIASAPHVFRETLRLHRGGPFFIECRGAIAQFEPLTESLTFYAASQGAHRLKRALSDMFDFADHQVRVITFDVGGGFGPKGSFYPEYPTITAAAMQLGRPVKWIEDRRENFVTTHQERDQVWALEIAVDDAARILGLRGACCTKPAPTCPGASCCHGSRRPRCRGPM